MKIDLTSCWARRLQLSIAAFGLCLLVACGSTSKMHFADFSSVDFSLPNRGASLGLGSGVGRVVVSGGDYTKIGEFEDYSWHSYEGVQAFRRLPYPDLDRQVEAWISDLLRQNGVVADSSSAPALDVFVRQFKLKTQKGSGYDYRACLVTLEPTTRDKANAAPRQSTLQGLAKLHGSDMNLVAYTRQGFTVSGNFGPDEPSVCKLAIANALRNAQQ